MTRPVLTTKKRQKFETMFADMQADKSLPEGKETVSRATYAVTKPMSDTQEILNRYKRRLAYSLEVRNTAYGLAAVQALQEDMLELAMPGRHQHELRRAENSLLRKATDMASFNKFSIEAESASFFEQNSLTLAYKEWLDEKLVEMDLAIEMQKTAALIAEETADNSAPGM